MNEEAPLQSGDDAIIEELLKRPSSLPPLDFALNGFACEEDAREIANLVSGFLRLFGTNLQLERLEAVTIAFDYANALSKIDRGGFSQTLTPTQDNFAVGVAMAVPVLRNGIIRAHIVLDARFAMCLKNADDPYFQLAFHLLAHEAAHVHDYALQDRAFPGLFGRAISDSRDATLFQIAHACWEEYIASRLSARYAAPDRTEHFEDTFCSYLTGIRDRSNASIRKFRLHGDVMRLLAEVAVEYGNALKYGAYLLGHIDGLEKPFATVTPKALAAIKAVPSFAELFGNFALNLTTMYQTYGQWTGLEIFEPLNRTIDEVLKFAGIEFQPRPGGNYYLNVPFTEDTLPFR